MPELPEVFTIVSDLQKNICNFQIKNINISKGYVVKPNNETFIKNVNGHKITNISRIAKNIIIELDTRNYIHIHLAMTGQLLLHKTKCVDKWTRITFTLEKNSQIYILNFTDMRMFGKVALIDTSALQQLKNKYGVEPIANNINMEELLKKITSKKTTIKNILMEQEIVAGLGNIYATDTLFLAGIHPETITTNIKMKHLEKIINAAKLVLNESIKNRGSTLADKMYVDIFGKSGNQQNYFKIYTKEICPSCNKKVLVKKINGRGTYFCENCQKLITNSNGLFDI